jgi:hypothetical protein
MRSSGSVTVHCHRQSSAVSGGLFGVVGDCIFIDFGCSSFSFLLFPFRIISFSGLNPKHSWWAHPLSCFCMSVHVDLPVSCVILQYWYSSNYLLFLHAYNNSFDVLAFFLSHNTSITVHTTRVSQKSCRISYHRFFFLILCHIWSGHCALLMSSLSTTTLVPPQPQTCASRFVPHSTTSQIGTPRGLALLFSSFISLLSRPALDIYFCYGALNVSPMNMISFSSSYALFLYSRSFTLVPFLSFRRYTRSLVYIRFVCCTYTRAWQGIVYAFLTSTLRARMSLC